MSKNSSSARWKARQARDPFVKRAQAEGWRSRAVFKLSELQGRERLFKPGSVVVDLGAAPVPGASSPPGWLAPRAWCWL